MRLKTPADFRNECSEGDILKLFECFNKTTESPAFRFKDTNRIMLNTALDKIPNLSEEEMTIAKKKAKDYGWKLEKKDDERGYTYHFTPLK